MGGLGSWSLHTGIQPLGIDPSLSKLPKRVAVFLALSIGIWRSSALLFKVVRRRFTRAIGETSGLEGLFIVEVEARPIGTWTDPGLIVAGGSCLNVSGSNVTMFLVVPEFGDGSCMLFGGSVCPLG